VNVRFEKRRTRAPATKKRSALPAETLAREFLSWSQLCAPVTPPDRHWKVSGSQIIIAAGHLKSAGNSAKKSCELPGEQGMAVALGIHASQEVTH
jgi:hypothetical protein